jgi:hypothetical protein
MHEASGHMQGSVIGGAQILQALCVSFLPAELFNLRLLRWSCLELPRELAQMVELPCALAHLHKSREDLPGEH